ncbi:MAG: hypothetical protein IMZ55_14105, partial [Acidobacteria bacterium]|nr:hypothetical protein [Acidobacteriota bacterium]
SSTLTAGLVLWTLKGGTLAKAALAALPLWRWIDPLPVLEQKPEERPGGGRGRDEDGDEGHGAKQAGDPRR